MAWPARLRAMSFSITFAVVMMECALWALPVGLGLWYWRAAAPASIVTWMVWISIAISIVISGQAHIRGQRYSAAARGREA